MAPQTPAHTTRLDRRLARLVGGMGHVPGTDYRAQSAQRTTTVSV